DICDKLKESISSYGCEILSKFNTVNISKLSVDLLKYWFLHIVVDPFADVVKKEKSFNHRDLYRFLKNDIDVMLLRKAKNIIGFMRKILKYYKKELVNTKSIPISNSINYLPVPDVTIIRI